MAKVGRPSSFTKEIAETICKEMGKGASLTTVCKAEGIPSRDSVIRWLKMDGPEYDQFRVDYAQARERQADAYFDEVVDLADGVAYEAGLIAEQAAEKAPKGCEADTYRRVYNEEIQARKLRIDSRKWVLARMNRAKFGDRAEVNVTGDPKKPVTIALPKISEDQRGELIDVSHRLLQGGE